MPIRRRRVTVRRPRRVRRRTFRRISRVPRHVPLGISKARFVKLSYCDQLASAVGASSYQSWGYQSSLYDPYASVGGHQPMFFDQYSAMYRRYTVLGMAYDIQACTESTTNGPLVITVTPSNVGSSPTSISMARERPGTKESIVSHGYKGRVKGYISVAKMLGVDRRKLLTDDQYSALISADPSQMASFTVQAWNNSSASGINIYLTLRITFYCRFFDPAEPSQS